MHAIVFIGADDQDKKKDLKKVFILISFNFRSYFKKKKNNSKN